MDVLVVIDRAAVPPRLAGRARRRVDVVHGPVDSGTVAELRAHIPRSVGVIGPPGPEGARWLADVAGQLHRAGLPVTVYTDEEVPVDPGIEVDRRILADLAVNEPATFAGIVEAAKKALPADTSAPKAAA